MGSSLDYFPCREMHTFDAVLPCGPGSWSAYPPLVPWVPRQLCSTVVSDGGGRTTVATTARLKSRCAGTTSNMEISPSAPTCCATPAPLGPVAATNSGICTLVNAAQTVSLRRLAPGRIMAAFGTGFSSRAAMGQPPIRWSYMEAYIRAYQALLAGEVVDWERAAIRLMLTSAQADALPLGHHRRRTGRPSRRTGPPGGRSPVGGGNVSPGLYQPGCRRGPPDARWDRVARCDRQVPPT